jgi:hypothetical protein
MGLHVLLPEVSLGNIGAAEFPVLFRFVDARQKALSLFFLGEVEEELDDTGSVLVKVSLQICNRAIPVAPDHFFVMRRIRKPFTAENLGVYAGRSALPHNRIG